MQVTTNCSPGVGGAGRVVGEPVEPVRAPGEGAENPAEFHALSQDLRGQFLP